MASNLAPTLANVYPAGSLVSKVPSR